MIIEQHKKLILSALACYRGDDLARAKREFAGMTNLGMEQPFGQSGKTRREVLQEYQDQADAVDAAVAWVKSL